MKIGKLIYNALSALVLIVFITLAFLLIGVRAFGFTPYAVLSGSMEPLYETGSAVYIKSVEVEDIEVGDVITFYMSGSTTVVTHQVIEIDEENGLYYTKGLANETADGTPTSAENIIGKVYFGIPYLGYISSYVTSPPWLYIIIAAVLIWIIIIYMVEISKEDDTEEPSERAKKKARRKARIKASKQRRRSKRF